MNHGETTRRAGLDVVGAALDLLSLVADGMAKPGGPRTIRAGLDRVADAAAHIEQLCADRLDDLVGHAPPTAAERRSAAAAHASAAGHRQRHRAAEQDHDRARRGEPCWLCGQPIDLSLPPRTPASFSVDHVTPQSLGGDPYDQANLRPAHHSCNSARGNGTRTNHGRRPNPRRAPTPPSSTPTGSYRRTEPCDRCHGGDGCPLRPGAINVNCW